MGVCQFFEEFAETHREPDNLGVVGYECSGPVGDFSAYI
jgi:hypothetical protein